MSNTASAPGRAIHGGWPAFLARARDLLASSRVALAGVLVLVSLACFLPGFFTIPPVDRDEARFAQATKQMVETGDFVDIRFQDEPRHKKPIGIYWLQATAVALSGEGAQAPIWVYRLPSLLAAVAGVLLTYWVALPLVGQGTAALAALFMATSVLLGVEARLAKTDAALLAATLGAIGFLARAYLRQPISTAGALLFWTALAAGVLLKGPVILLVAGLTALALSLLDRSGTWLRSLRPLSGALWALLLVMPWFVAIAVSSKGGFFVASLGQDMLGKVVAAQESHGAPPGAYLLAFWGTFWPAAVLAIMAAPWVWRHRAEPAVRFCLAWAVPCWLVFEAMPTKLPHYVLPLLPAIAILTALPLTAGLRPGRLLAWLIPAGGAAAAIAAAVVCYTLERKVSLLALPLSALGIGALGLAAHFAVRGAIERFAAGLAVGTALLSLAVFGGVIPHLNSLWISPRLAAAVERQAPCPHPEVAATGFHEPSLVFLVGTRTALVGGAQAADFLVQGDCRLALVEHRRETEFEARLAQLGRPALLGERIEGLNLNGGRRLDIGVYRLQDKRS